MIAFDFMKKKRERENRNLKNLYVSQFVKKKRKLERENKIELLFVQC